MKHKHSAYRIVSILMLAALFLTACSTAQEAGTGTDGAQGAAASEAAASAAAQEQKAEGAEAAQEGAAAAEKTVLTLTIPFAGIESFEEAFEKLYPQYELEVEYLPTGVINGEISRRLKNHHASDLIVTNLPAGDSLEYAYDLSTQAFVENYQAQISKSLAYDGKTRYIPLPGSLFGYIINKTLLNELGLDVPETKEAFLAVLKAAKEKNLGVNQNGFCFGLGTIGATYTGIYFLSDFATDYLSTMDGVKWLADFQNGNATFTGTWEPCTDFLKTCVDEGYLDPQKLLVYYNQSMSSTANAFKPEEELPGRTAIATYGHLQYYDSICEKSEDEFVLVPLLPESESGNKLFSAASSYFLFINKDIETDAAKLEGSLRLMEFLSTEEGQRCWMQDTMCPYTYLNGMEVELSLIPEGAREYVTNGQIYTNPFQTELLSVMGMQLVPVIAKGADKAAALAAIDDYCINGSEEMEQDLSVVGTVAVDMLYQNSNTRYEETELGNLVSDAVRELSGADVALVNGGGIRSSLYKGDVTGSDLSAVCPYGNLIIVAEMDGATLKEALTNGIQKTWKPAGQFLQVSGIHYSYIPAKDETEVAVLTSVTHEDGSEVKDDEILKVAYNNYMGGSGSYVDSGDGFTMLNVYDEATPIGVRLTLETGKTYKDALISYFAAHASEEITSPLEGRITVEDKE